MKKFKTARFTAVLVAATLVASSLQGAWNVYPGDVDDGGWTTWANQSYSVVQSGSDEIFSAWARVDTYQATNIVTSTHRIDNAYNWVQISSSNAYSMLGLASISNISDADNRNAEAFAEVRDPYMGAFAIVHAERDPYN